MADLHYEDEKRKTTILGMPKGVFYVLAGGACTALGAGVAIALLNRGNSGTQLIQMGTKLIEQGSKKLKGV